MFNLKKVWDIKLFRMNFQYSCYKSFHLLIKSPINSYNSSNISNQDFLNKSFLKFQKKNEIKKQRSFEKCNIIPNLEKFFSILINENKPNLISLLKANLEFPLSVEFILNAYSINKHTLKDLDLDNILINVILADKKNFFSRINNKEQIFELCRLFSNKYMESESNPMGKKMMEVLKNKSYLMEKNELMALIDIFNENSIEKDIDRNKYLKKKKESYMDNILMKYIDANDFNDPVRQELLKRQEKSNAKKIEFLKKENLEFDLNENQKSKIHIDKNNIKLDKDNIVFSINLNKNRASIRSKLFKPKVYIYAFDDNKIKNIMPVYNVVDKVEANVILFQERPIAGLHEEDKYVGYFDKQRIKHYYREILSKKKDLYYFNKMEKIVSLLIIFFYYLKAF